MQDQLVDAVHEKVALRTALQRAALCRLAIAAADDGGECEGDKMEHGSEDLPDAGRSVPVSEKDLSCNIVMLVDPINGTLLSQIVYALLFGHRASVIHSLTWAEFQHIFAKMWLVLMWMILDLLRAQRSLWVGKASSFLGPHSPQRSPRSHPHHMLILASSPTCRVRSRSVL